jgi:hypothetical protein
VCVLIVLSRRNYTNDGRNNNTSGERVRLRDKERALSAAFHCFEVFSLPAVRAFAAAACVRRVFLALVSELQFVLRERKRNNRLMERDRKTKGIKVLRRALLLR